MKYGANEKSMIEQAYKQRGKAPDPIADAPDLFPWLAPYYQAFEALTSDRPTDFFSGNIGYIPWLVIRTYCMDDEYLGSDFAHSLFYIRSLDTHFVKLHRESMPKPPPKGARSPSEKPTRKVGR